MSKENFMLRYGSSKHIENALKGDLYFSDEVHSAMSNPAITHDQMRRIVSDLPSTFAGTAKLGDILSERPDIPSDVIENIAERVGHDVYIHKGLINHPNVTKKAIQHIITHENVKFPKREAVIDSLKVIQKRLPK